MNSKILCAGTVVVDIITGTIKGAVYGPSGHNTIISSNAGGNALNVAMNLAGLEIPPDNIFCCGAVGKDMEADFLKNTLTDAGIIEKTIATDITGTGKAIILAFDNNERSFVVDHGSSTHFRYSDLLAVLNEVKPSIFYIGESPASPDIDSNLPDIMKKAKELDCINILDYIIQDINHPSEILFDSAPFTDVLHINEHEAKALCKTENIEKAAELLRKKGFPVVFVSEGEKGFVLAYENSIQRFPVFSVDCVDATGAGDAFCSGIIHSILNLEVIPADLTELAIFASACGACAVTETGCTKGLTLKKAEELIASQGDKIRTNIRSV